MFSIFKSKKKSLESLYSSLQGALEIIERKDRRIFELEKIIRILKGIIDRDTSVTDRILFLEQDQIKMVTEVKTLEEKVVELNRDRKRLIGINEELSKELKQSKKEVRGLKGRITSSNHLLKDFYKLLYLPSMENITVSGSREIVGSTKEPIIKNEQVKSEPTSITEDDVIEAPKFDYYDERGDGQNYKLEER